jgi:hypothetical protein
MAKKATEKVDFVVFPSAARDLLLCKSRNKADSSGKTRPQNDSSWVFSAACKTAIHKARFGNFF